MNKKWTIWKANKPRLMTFHISPPTEIISGGDWMESGSALFPDRDLWCWLCSNVSVEETWDLVVIAVGGAALESGGSSSHRCC